MNTSIEQMLEPYNVQNRYDKKNAMKEIMQEIVLCGLSRAGFFKEAAFYGGTALRIFHGLDRFSEDLDFSLDTKDPSFDLAAYFPTLQKEVQSFGLNVEISEKKKSKESAVRSAFVKGNTREHLILFYAGDSAAESAAKNEVIKIKFEVDTDPPAFAAYEHKYKLLPVPYEVRLYDMPSLFAGKIHAVLARAWRNRIKGRDLYDYVFYLSRSTPVNLPHLIQRLYNSETVPGDQLLTLDNIKQMLYERFDSINYAQVKQDIAPFIHDPSVLDIWSADFFRQITKDLYQQ